VYCLWGRASAAVLLVAVSPSGCMCCRFLADCCNGSRVLQLGQPTGVCFICQPRGCCTGIKEEAGWLADGVLKEQRVWAWEAGHSRAGHHICSLCALSDLKELQLQLPRQGWGAPGVLPACLTIRYTAPASHKVPAHPVNWICLSICTDEPHA